MNVFWLGTLIGFGLAVIAITLDNAIQPGKGRRRR